MFDIYVIVYAIILPDPKSGIGKATIVVSVFHYAYQKEKNKKQIHDQ